MKGFLIGIIVVIMISAWCYSLFSDAAREEAVLQIEGHGYTNVNIDGVDFWVCSKNDTRRWDFHAEKDGKPVYGVLCGDFFGFSFVKEKH